MSRILQELRHSLQDFAQKVLVRSRASHANGTDERAIRQDCSGSCGALILVLRVRVANHSRDQLNVVSNLPGDHSASSLVAACDISCQSANRTARAWMIAMCFA